MLCLLTDSHLFREEHLLTDYFREIVVMSDLERDRAKQELICENTDAPDIDLAVVVLGFDHFWWRVKWGSALSIPKKRGMNSPAKVTDLDSIFHNQYVLRLDIPMDYVVLMHVLNSPTDLLYMTPHILLLHWLTAQTFVQVIPRTGLQQKIDSLCISGETVKIDDVRMVQKTLDLALSDQLGKGLLVQMALFNGFEAVQGISVKVLDKMNFPIAALIDEFKDFEDLLFAVDRKDFQLVLSRLLLCRIWNGLLWLFGLGTIFPLHNSLDLLGEAPAFILFLRPFCLFLSKSRVLFQTRTFLLILLLYFRQFTFIELFAINKITLFFSYKRGKRASCKILREKE